MDTRRNLQVVRAQLIRASLAQLRKVERRVDPDADAIRDNAHASIDSVLADMEHESYAPDPAEAPPRVHFGMSEEALNRLVEYNRTRCHVRLCQNPATHVYIKRHCNAHGGLSDFRYQRCEAHAVVGASKVVPWDSEGAR